MEMTRGFLASAYTRYEELKSELVGLESELIKSRDAFHETLSPTDTDLWREAHMTHTEKKAELAKRLDKIENISTRLKSFVKTTKEQQQPAMRLYQSTVTRKASSTSEKQIGATLYFRPDTRLELLATILCSRSNLLMVTENALLAHYLKSKAREPLRASRPIDESLFGTIRQTRLSNRVDNTEVLVDFISQSASRKAKASMKSCQNNINAARAESLPGPEVDAIVIFVKMVAIWRQLPRDPNSFEKLNEAIKEATTYLDEADKVCEGQFTGVDDMKETLEVVRKQLSGGTFYQDITDQEMETVVRAMKGSLRFEFSTGRWYYCQNGHPFAVGDCGRPMVEVKCPECNAPVGGTDHNPAAGVRSAAELDAIIERE
ncbi:uncharacterized protein H6S33_010577 [Morchella sextelata]|uniref:uncharacterized protein n=1 Tax=Morchella sextelata TaxID=1174677 RepID=UPI001D047945|nr:uncharacterized protein H6S33_010577 [Morchella sextelata]KAH0611312.1 hypothetical protein H6S33_010577 [Morchella sextelata]